MEQLEKAIFLSIAVAVLLVGSGALLLLLGSDFAEKLAVAGVCAALVTIVLTCIDIITD